MQWETIRKIFSIFSWSTATIRAADCTNHARAEGWHSHVICKANVDHALVIHQRAPHRTSRVRTPFARMLPRIINRVLLRKSEWIHRQRHQIQRDRMRDFQVSAT